MRKLILVAFCVFCLIPSICFSQNIKKPNVAGQFYSSDKSQLSRQIDQFLDQADVRIYHDRVPMVIVPHAGYIYSGQTAAYAFKAVSRQNPHTVIVLAPSHHVRLDGFSVWNQGAFETPLGQIAVDAELAEQLRSVCTMCVFEPQAFEKEHSLEVELPFIQKVFPQAKIIPVIVGQTSLKNLESFAASLGQLIAGREDVRIIVSSDWSHYHDEATARTMDQHGMDLVKSLNPEQLWQDVQEGQTELCGIFPVLAAMFLAKQQGWTHVDILQTATSGKATGDYNKVVGYAAIAFYSDGIVEKKDYDQGARENSSALSLEEKRQLFDIAEKTVHQFVTDQTIRDVSAPTESLKESQGVFVTLKKQGQLRGCIGRIVTDQPLYLSTRDMAVAAASEDPRFPSVRPEELKDIEIEISVLSKPRDVSNADEIVLGRDGVIIGQGMRQGVFLPQVADETGWTKEKFLSELCSQKAGLPSDCWQDPQTRIKIFTADVFAEKDLE